MKLWRFYCGNRKKKSSLVARAAKPAVNLPLPPPTSTSQLKPRLKEGQQLKITAMLFTAYLKALALFCAVTLLAVPMASSSSTEDVKLEDAKDAMAGVAQEGAHRQVHEHDTRARKPRLGNMGVRQSWKECVGMDVMEAVEVIRAARPDLKKIIRVQEGTMVTMDMRMDRVRVYCGPDNVVTRPPRVG